MIDSSPRVEPAVESGAGAPLELVTGSLVRLGSSFLVRGDDLSWLPPDRRGYEPINAYLLITGAEATLLDTGVVAQRATVLAQLRTLLGPDRPLSVALTRSEADCSGNLDAIMIARTVPTVYAIGGWNVNPLAYVDKVALAGLSRGARLVRFGPGESVAIAPGRELLGIRPGVRLLSSGWTYDAATATLFTSDMFGHVGLDGPGDSPVWREEPRERDRTAARAYLLKKFEWLEDADLALVRRWYDAAFGARRIARLAPTHGCVLEGESVVRAHVAMVRELIGSLDGGPTHR